MLPLRLFAVLLVLAALAGADRGGAPALIRLAELAARERGMPAVHCGVGSDARESLVFEPGEELALTLRVPPSGVLRFALAARDPNLPAPPWRLALRDTGNTRTELLAHEETPSHGWQERSLDLGRWAGRTVALEARVAAPGQRAGPVCWATPIVAPRRWRGPLIVVVLLDTVRADHLGLYGYLRPTTPALERLAADGITFTRFASDASWTRASVATLFTGQAALTHGVLSRDAHLDKRWPTLAERLRAAGFRTVAFSTNPNVLPFWGFARGFDRFVDVDAERWTENSDAGRVLDEARAAIDDAGSAPLLVYVHVNDAHAPYDPPAQAARALLGHYDPASAGRLLDRDATAVDVQGAIDRYDGEIAYLDAELGRFLDGLKARERYHGALIVVVGDHGEEFLDHGGVYHGHTLFREQLSVPLVVKLPGEAGAGTRVTGAAGMRDVLPTMLHVLGQPSGDLPGRVLLEARGRPHPGTSLPRFAVTDMDDTTAYAVEDGGFALIVQTRPTERRWLFDQEADPLQEHDLAAGAGAELASLGRLLDAELLTRRAGWHVRVCGGPTATSVTLRLASAAPLARVERLGIEEADVVTLGEDSRALTLTASLTPRIHHEERFGTLVAERRPDQDELVLSGPASLELAVEETHVPVLVGAAGRRLTPGSGSVRRAEADAPAVWVPECPPEQAILVWHAGTANEQTPVDPDIARRLRALGYLR